MVSGQDDQPGCKFPLPPLEDQSDIQLSPEEWKHLWDLHFPPKASSNLKRVMTR